MEEIGTILGIVFLGIGLIVGCGFLLRDILFQGRTLQEEPNNLKQELLVDTV